MFFIKGCLMEFMFSKLMKNYLQILMFKLQKRKKLQQKRTVMIAYRILNQKKKIKYDKLLHSVLLSDSDSKSGKVGTKKYFFFFLILII